MCLSELALVAGRNAMCKAGSLTEYFCRFIQINTAISWSNGMGRCAREVSLGTGTSFDIEFHNIPYHGDNAFTEKHFVSKRSSSQKGLLSLVVRDVDTRLFVYADVRQNNQQQQLMQLVGF